MGLWHERRGASDRPGDAAFFDVGRETAENLQIRISALQQKIAIARGDPEENRIEATPTGGIVVDGDCASELEEGAGDGEVGTRDSGRGTRDSRLDRGWAVEESRLGLIRGATLALPDDIGRGHLFGDETSCGIAPALEGRSDPNLPHGSMLWRIEEERLLRVAG